MLSTRLLFIILLPYWIYAQPISVTFEVDLSYQVELGNFNPENEFVDIAGTFNNWGGELIRLSDADNDSIYSVTIATFNSGQLIEFKFRFNGQWDDREEFPGAGNNRIFTVEEDTTLFFWYSDEEPPVELAPGEVLADFISLQAYALAGSKVTFKSQSLGEIEEFQWQFPGGDPEISDEENPVVTYHQSGTYDVQLTVISSVDTSTLIREDLIRIKNTDPDALSWWNETTFYEIFVRSFYDSDGDGIGDFQGIIEKLDYLNDGDPSTTSDLGITGIWLMPINPSPTYHGYDVTDYRGINPDYGTMEDFRQFLEAAHERGIRVIIDYVMNHTSTQIDWFQDSRNSSSDKRNWYRWSDSNPGYSGPWGQQVWHSMDGDYYYGLFWGGMPDLNYQEPAVKAEMFDIADFWLNEIGIDGFRLDAVKYIYEDGSQLEDLETTFQFWREFDQHIENANPEAVAVGEAWTNSEKIVSYVENEGIDFCFDFDLSNRIIEAVESANGNDLLQHVSKINLLYPYYQYATFLTNHDQNRIMDVLDRNPDRVKAAASLYLTLPGVPFIYYGEEVGMLGQKPDENIRRPMSWSGERAAGFTSASPWNAPAGNFEDFNVQQQTTDPGSLLQHYRTLISLRNNRAALRTGNFTPLASSSDNIICYLRETETEQLIVAVNLLPEQVENATISMNGISPRSSQPVLYDLYQREIIADGITDSGDLANITLPAYGTRIFQFEQINANRKQESILIYPNPTSERIQITGVEDAQNITIVDQRGRIVLRKYEPGQYIHVGTLHPGVYLLKVEGRSGAPVYARFIKE